MLFMSKSTEGEGMGEMREEGMGGDEGGGDGRR